MEQPKILVAIRKRPLSKKESGKGETDIISVKNGDTVIVSEYKQKVDLTKYIEETIFNFDFAFHQDTSNEEIYDLAVRPLVDSAFQGAKVTCFAYGQTGSGKTFTMNGVMHQGVPGLYTLGAQDIFDYLASVGSFRHLKARLSFYQIYCGKLYDLLNKRTELKLREDNKNNINIIGLEEASVNSTEDFIEYLSQGSKERVTSQNSANADSSRSHAILQITLKDGKKTFGKISFIDLAGNERGADHMDMNKQTRIDGAEINKSLLSLKECIRALDQGKGHTPFRGSKLTMVLKDSFVGFCRTVMIGNVSPSSASSENTLNTLRYADRVKELRRPQEGTKQDMKSREMMLPRNNKNAIKIMINNDDDMDDINDKKEEARKEYGISDEPTRKVKEESSGKKQNKSTSVAKNHASSLANKNNPVRPGSRREEPNPNIALNRYNSSQYGVGSKREEPMEIESPSPPYFMPSTKSSGRNPIPRLTGQNQTYNLSNNCSNISMNSNLNISQPRNFNQPNYPQPNYNQQPNYPPQNYNQNFSQYPQQNQGNYPQQQQPSRPQQYGQNPNLKNNNFFNTPQSRQQQQQMQYVLPENWQQLAGMVNSGQEPELAEQIVSEMNRRLFSQQQQLAKNHSQSLRRQIQIIKSQMGQLAQMEVDRSKISSRGYVQFMQDSIQQKISLLEQLRQKMISFTYKLDTIEEIERNGNNKHMEIDEQLLDDIN